MTGPAGTAERRVLVINRGALGDVLLSLPLMAALPDHFGSDALTVVGNPSILGLLADLPFVAETMDQNRADWAGLYEDPPRPTARLTGFILGHRAGVVLTRDPADPMIAGLEHVGLTPLLRVPSRPPAGRAVHLTDHMFAESGVRPRQRFVRLTPDPDARLRAEAMLHEWNLKPGRWVALHPGSGSVEKNWPLPNWLALAREMEAASGWPVLFILGPAEGRQAESLQAQGAGFRPRVGAGLSLPLLAALLSLSRAYVGHDSGVTHLVAALGRPTLAVFGPTDPAHWAPNGPLVRRVAPPAPSSDWSWLRPETIRTALAGLLESGG